MAANQISYYRAPVGVLKLESAGPYLTALSFIKDSHAHHGLAPKSSTIHQQAHHWLNNYFDGVPPKALPPLKYGGTAFQRQVWQVLLTIPYGATMTYKEVANIVAKKHGLSRMSAQAVGGAVGSNPISLIIPCHRVLGSNGSLTGYAHGLTIKEQLLSREGSLVGGA